ncbi:MULTISPECIES: helix-turn-helix domain-containing protein [Providencia]|uniref:helix-turn-helix domain-containing protein n=1 Tax=Providencia TaxID=586 RepID=UPI00141A3ADE|nr:MULTISPECIES: helix-turn-helix transcriptional regulator [Providencia]ELR5148848.1 helix-turn-helix transcriptional regulator [Providencia rettgeri]MBS0918335.1 helix-turn-helix transcriptional regulator [Providencia rettgeri]NIA43149.1 helix-turn-helix transcriptional regulator [Providencia rettgeri]NIA96857.1 helix-turn-helix transcriptional regulator [Providencia rettgeri]NIB14458.1 helix-turn-helix transcriptional regulator [Providencia rettgeri]
MSNKTVGEFIKVMRLAKNISTDIIAGSLTISEDEYIQCENGTNSLYVDDLLSIAELLDIEVSSLLSLHRS